MYVREALPHLLREIGAEVLCAVRDGDELRAYLADNQPDVVITDLRMPPGGASEGVRVARWVKARYPETGVLVFSDYDETAHAMQVISDDSRGVGYLLKKNLADGKALRGYLERVRCGGIVIDPDMVRRLLASPRRADELASLTSRERDVLRYLAEGYSNRQIAENLFVEIRTVESHLQSVYQKLGISGEAGTKRVKATLKWLRVDNP